MVNLLLVALVLVNLTVGQLPGGWVVRKLHHESWDSFLDTGRGR